MELRDWLLGFNADLLNCISTARLPSTLAPADRAVGGGRDAGRGIGGNTNRSGGVDIINPVSTTRKDRVLTLCNMKQSLMEAMSVKIGKASSDERTKSKEAH